MFALHVSSHISPAAQWNSLLPVHSPPVVILHTPSEQLKPLAHVLCTLLLCDKQGLPARGTAHTTRSIQRTCTDTSTLRDKPKKVGHKDRHKDRPKDRHTDRHRNKVLRTIHLLRLRMRKDITFFFLEKIFQILCQQGKKIFTYDIKCRQTHNIFFSYFIL